MATKDKIKYLVCMLGHPIVFWIYLFVLGGYFEESDYFYYQISTNVYRINPLSYFVVAAILYSSWIAFQYYVLSRWRGVSWEAYFSQKFTRVYVILCALGYLNLVMWFIGMEGNAFGFLFFVPLQVLTWVLIYFELKLFFPKRWGGS